MVPEKLSESRVNRFLGVDNTATSNKPGLDSEFDLISTLKAADPLTIGTVRARPSSRGTLHGVEPTASCKTSLTRETSTPTSDKFHRR